MDDAGEIQIKALHQRNWEGKAILLVDLDAFYASVEQLDHPAWRGKPVIVGSPAAVRGVVSTASYEARAYGVRSAMASSIAQRLCPEGIWVMPRHDRYKELSDDVMALLYDETPYVQQVSIDEAFLDVTPSRINREHPAEIARRIQKRVGQLGVSCSIGAATSKTVAKIASEQGKPHGLTVVRPGEEAFFLKDLPVGAMSGIGAASVEFLHRFGIRTLGQLACAEDDVLKRAFGKNAQLFRLRAQGKEESAVETNRVVKSVSHEVSFPQDISDEKELMDTLFGLSQKVGRRLREKHFLGSTVTVKMRFANRTVRSAQETLDVPTNNELVFWRHAQKLFGGLWAPHTPVRLLGVSMSGLQTVESDGEIPFAAARTQATLFDDAELDFEGVCARDQTSFPQGESGRAQRSAQGKPGESETAGISAVAPSELTEKQRRKLQSLVDVSDQVKNRFGEGALRYGRSKRTPEN